jgi:ribosomal protein S18 acetylase RimI-like enzyme
MADSIEATNDDVIIGVAQPAELDSILRVMCAAFRMEYEAAHPIYFNDPRLDAADKMVVRFAQKVASCVTLVQGRSIVGHSSIATCGLAGVATAPSFQRRGYATMLVNAALGEVARRGSNLALLTASEPDYYLRRGWAVVGRNYSLQVDRQNLPQAKSALRVRTMRHDDADRADIVRSNTANYSLKSARSALQWSGLIDRLSGSVVVEDATGDLAGYLFIQNRLGKILSSGPSVPPAVHVLEAVATGDAARHALLSWLARRPGPQRVDFEVPEVMLRNLHLTNLVGASMRVSTGCLGYVTNFAASISAMLPNWNDLQPTPMVLVCRYNDGSAINVNLNLANRSVVVLSESSSRVRLPIAEAPADVWAQVICGYISAVDAIAAESLVVRGGEIHKLLANMFPARSPMLAPPDLF